MLQVKSRPDAKSGMRFMATICFYQDTRHEKPLHWIRRQLGIGYVTRRKDGMTELRINGFERVRDILAELKPFVRFKARQAQAMIIACDLLSKKFVRNMSKSELKRLVDLVFVVRSENYKSRTKFSREEMNKYLGLTP